jgi:hypothetical protein
MFQVPLPACYLSVSYNLHTFSFILSAASSGRSHPTQPAAEVQMLAGLNEVADDYKVGPDSTKLRLFLASSHFLAQDARLEVLGSPACMTPKQPSPH